MTAAYLVTGATGPLAEATIRALAKRGDRLLLCGRNAARLDELSAEYGNGGQVRALVADTTTPDGANEAARAVLDHFGRLDGLVHLIGAFRGGPVVATEPEAYAEVLRLNFLSAVIAAQAVLPRLTDGGRMVFFGTPLAQEPLAGLSAYAAAKAAMMTWVRSFSHEVKHRGVHANVVVMTMADTAEARRNRPDADFTEAVTPEMVAGTVGFLTSDAADGLYGSLVPVLGRFGLTTGLIGRR